MKRFVEGEDRRQGVLLPEYLDDFVAEENQVRVIEAAIVCPEAAHSAVPRFPVVVEHSWSQAVDSSASPTRYSAHRLHG